MTINHNSEVFLIDASGFIHRAFHASEKQETSYRYNAAGHPVGAVKLFTERCFWLRKKGAYNRFPTHMALVFDHGGGNFRHQLYPAYKSNRPPKPEDMRLQEPIMREAAEALGIAIVDQPGYEADDLICTYANTAAEMGAAAMIISSDKDLMQIIRPGVTMYDPEMGTPGFAGYRPAKYIGHDEVVEKWSVPPEQVVEVQALWGDAGDHIPGVPKVGEKTAKALIQEYGSMEAVLAAAPTMKKSVVRDNLIAFADQARLSKQLARLDGCVDYEMPLEAMTLTPIDHDRVIDFAIKWDIPHLVRLMEKDIQYEQGRAA